MKEQIEGGPYDPSEKIHHAEAVARERASLVDRVTAALAHLDEADNRLWELSAHLHDPAYIEVATGYDIGHHLQDAARSLRAALALAQQANS